MRKEWRELSALVPRGENLGGENIGRKAINVAITLYIARKTRLGEEKKEDSRNFRSEEINQALRHVFALFYPDFYFSSLFSFSVQMRGFKCPRYYVFREANIMSFASVVHQNLW